MVRVERSLDLEHAIEHRNAILDVCHCAREAVTNAGNDPIADCGTAALTEYEKSKAAILTPKTSDSPERMMDRLISIDGTIAIRRLEEGYCLKFAQCIRKPSDDPLTLALHFNSCIEDEDTERVLDDLRA